MHIDIVVPFQDAPAHFSVVKESEGIYLAILQRYEGEEDQAPPLRIVLIKGMRNWTGSYEHPGLLSAIGQAIEEAAVKEPLSKGEQVKQ